MNQPKYERRHYQDVAQILRAAYQWEHEQTNLEDFAAEHAITKIRESFERLFATDSPDTFDLEKFRHATTTGGLTCGHFY